MSKKKFSFLIVNYNSEQYLEDCISSIFKKHPGDGFEIIVINNNDKGDFQSSVCARHSNIRLINNNENIGFGRAHNIGAQESQGDILVILNPDAHFTSIDFAEILSRFERENDLGIIAPRIVDEKGDDQKWSAGRKITPWGIIRNNANLSKDRNPLNQKQESEVDWVTGAAFFIKKDTFEKIGGFDENFFMYFEDIDLCHRIRKNGGRIIGRRMINLETILMELFHHFDELNTLDKKNRNLSQTQRPYLIN